MYYISYGNISTYECMLLLYVYFPTFYFDIYEEIIDNSMEEKELLKIINRINDYEVLLKVYVFKDYNTNSDIEWLKNVNNLFYVNYDTTSELLL